MGTVGFVVVSYNDLDLSQKMYKSLVDTLSECKYCKYGYALTVVDAGSTDGSVQFWEGIAPVISKHNPELCNLLDVKPEDLMHLSVCLNAGTKHLLMNDKVDKVMWIHPDCTFVNTTWCSELVDFIDNNPWTGKAASDDVNQIKQTRFPANQQPHMISRKCIEDMIEKDGYLYDTRFLQIGGFEDLDLARRQLLMGYVPVIVGNSVLEHPSMLSRQRHDTTKYGFYNAGMMYNKWTLKNIGDFAEGIEDFWSKLDWRYER